MSLTLACVQPGATAAAGTPLPATTDWKTERGSTPAQMRATVVRPSPSMSRTGDGRGELRDGREFKSEGDVKDAAQNDAMPLVNARRAELFGPELLLRRDGDAVAA